MASSIRKVCGLALATGVVATMIALPSGVASAETCRSGRSAIVGSTVSFKICWSGRAHHYSVHASGRISDTAPRDDKYAVARIKLVRANGQEWYEDAGHTTLSTDTWSTEVTYTDIDWAGVGACVVRQNGSGRVCDAVK